MSPALILGMDILYREAYYLDNQSWDEWLALFFEDCEYWVPAWKAEHELTDNPKRELSLIYYSRRAGLEDRVWRVRSGRSVASTPMPRTQRAVTNIMVGSESEDSIKILSNWTVLQFKTKRREVDMMFGRCEHSLVKRDGIWRISRKKIILVNDYLPEMLDFYCL